MASNANPGEVTDRVQKEKGDYKYTFAVCSTIAAPTVCQNPDGSSRTVIDLLGSGAAHSLLVTVRLLVTGLANKQQR